MDNFFEFRCSYKLFSISLSEYNKYAGNKFSIKSFPHKFSTKENLNYIGSIPDKKYFNDLNSYNEYTQDKDLFNFVFDYKKELIEYCLNDVRITYDLILNFYNSISSEFRAILKSSYSIPSFSYKIFFTKFNNFKIKKNISKEDYSYIKESYYGGRCEVFGNPYEGEITHYFDYSGMYGQCMQEKFPIGEGKYYINCSKDYYKLPGFHYIDYKSDMYIPVLPYRKDKLLFPNGINSGLYWYEEIIKFVENGGEILKLHNSLIFEKEEYVFSDFMEYFNNIRSKGGFHKKIAKNIINSLYGGFALKEEDYFTHISFSDIEAEDIRYNFDVISQNKIGYCYFSKIKKDIKSNKVFNKNESKWFRDKTIRNVMYSSIIASKARNKLYNSFKNVIKDGGRLLYCDTDSIFASYKNSRLNNELYDIKWSNTYSDSFFISPKFYGYIENDKKFVKIKGVDIDDSEVDCLYDKIKEMFYKNENFIKIDNQTVFNNKNFDISIKNISKDIYLNYYDKRKFDEKKKNTQAIRIEERRYIDSEYKY